MKTSSLHSILFDFTQRLILTLGVSALTAIALGYFDNAPVLDISFKNTMQIEAPAQPPLNSTLK